MSSTSLVPHPFQLGKWGETTLDPSFLTLSLCQREVPGWLRKQRLLGPLDVVREDRRVTWLLFAPTASFDQIPVAALIHPV